MVIRNLLRWPCDTLYPQELEPTSLTSSGRSVGIVRSRTKAMEFVMMYESVSVSFCVSLSLITHYVMRRDGFIYKGYSESNLRLF
jgi:hypothetical protein